MSRFDIKSVNQESLEGTVKFYSVAKGYGFLLLSNGEDVFFHTSSLVDRGYIPFKNDAVLFNIEDSPKGKRALNVQKVG